MITKQRLFVHIYVTQICNLKCKHCYYDAKPANSKVEHSLPVSDIANIIVSLCTEYDAFFDIEGGELFLRDDISKLFDILPMEYWGRITITTNGITKITITSDVILNLDEFRVSVEGHTNKLQRDIRGIDLMPVMKKCADLKSAGVQPVLRITLHKKNYRYLVEMLQYFIGQGFDKFSLYEFQSTGRGLEYKKEYVLDEVELVQVLKGLLTYPIVKETQLFKLNLNVRRTAVINTMRKELELKGYELIDLSGAASLVVDYDGSLGICPWNVGAESIGVYSPDKFILNIQHLFEKGELDHSCKHCSTIRVQANSNFIR
jgi:MoaA/NifB/PqqE/SkfB family radical SAM enzyme